MPDYSALASLMTGQAEYNRKYREAQKKRQGKMDRYGRQADTAGQVAQGLQLLGGLYGAGSEAGMFGGETGGITPQDEMDFLSNPRNVPRNY